MPYLEVEYITNKEQLITKKFNTMSEKKNSNYLLPIIVMFGLFAMISFVTGLQNPFGVIVKEQFALSDFESQLGNFANFIAYAFMGIPAGLILQRSGYRITAMLAVFIGLLGVALMFLSSVPAQVAENGTLIYILYISGAFVAGFSMCTLNVVVNPMLNTLGGGGKKGNQLLQFGGATNSLAATLVPILVGYLIGGEVSKATLIDARVALYIAIAIFAVALIVLYISKLPEPILEEIAKNGKGEKVSMGGVFKYGHFVGGMVAIFLYVGIEVGIANMSNLYMTADTASGGLGMSAVVAGTIVGFYWLLMLVGRLIGGALGGLVSSKTMLSAVSGVGIIFLIIGINTSSEMITVFSQEIPQNVLWLVLCGLCTSVMWSAIFNLATEGLGKYTAIASGLFMVMVCGGGILPLVNSAVSDMVGYMDSFWVTIAALAYLLLYAIFAGNRKNATK